MPSRPPAKSPFDARLIGTTTAVAPAELRTFHRNPRRGDVKAIAASLKAHSQYKPITVNLGTHTGRPNEVLAGNHTLMAFRDLLTDPEWTGGDKILVHWVDVDDDMCNRIVTADNRIADLGTYDNADLLALLDAIPVVELPSIGYDAAILDALRREVFPPQTNTDPDDVPPVPEEPFSKVGQVWELGEHRLLVGDCTDIDAVRRMCGDVVPDCVWTDPPYGVDYVGKTHQALRIKNDADASLLVHLLGAAFRTVVAVCRPGAPVYIAAPAGPQFANFHTAMTEAGMLWRQTLTWAKNSIVMSRSDYHYQHEAILYGFTLGGKGQLGRGGPRWFGDNSTSSVFAFDRPSRSSDHPTMKPVGLIDAMLANSLPPGGVVFDPFAGSGSTLIAAHRRDDRCLAVELDPRYADVILRRFEDHTGISPMLDGTPVSLLAAN